MHFLEKELEGLSSYEFDEHFIKHENKILIGIDEVGRGPLAGPVLSAAISLDYKNLIEGLNDSKKLTEKKREKLLKEIIQNMLHIGIGMASVEEIDTYNIYQATILSMKRAIKNTGVKEGILLIDGLSFEQEGFSSHKVIKGDQKSAAIMAASIVAKQTRDSLMKHYATLYPEYFFEKHKGYGTKKHMEALKQFGPCKIHRKSFKPVSNML